MKLNMITMITMILATAITCASDLDAAPYCGNLTIKEDLPKKYQKRGPFYSDDMSGWIIGHDQLKTNFDVTAETNALWEQIAAKFLTHGTELVVLVAPPRPLFAPMAAREAMGLPGDLELIELQQGFSAYIAALNSAGIATPDLSDIAHDASAAQYYFARDTHWTPMGAAISAAYLKEAIDKTPADQTLGKIEPTIDYYEKGSLSGVVKDTCGTRPDAEIVMAPVYAQAGSAASLLGDSKSNDAIALIGTSFSDRYQRDAYQAAGALSFVMDTTVDNFSITGGGLVGAMEAFIRSGALTAKRYKTVVWETPYSTPLTYVDGLRQILGALHSIDSPTDVAELNTKIGDTWINLDQGFAFADVKGLEIETGTHSTGQMVVEFIDAHGAKTRTKLVKTDRVTPGMRSTIWSMALDEMGASDIVRIKLRLRGVSEQDTAVVRLFN
jgi:hypothetical protein